MKRTKKVKKILQPSFYDKFQTYLKNVGELLDEYNVPQDLIDKLAPLDIAIEEEIDSDMVELTDEKIIEILKEDEDLRYAVMGNLGDFCRPDNIEQIMDYIEVYQPQYRLIELDSLAEHIKLDEFIEQLRENPYQLKMAI